MKYDVLYYDGGNCYIETKEFVVDSMKELENESRCYAEVLINEGWDIAGWKYCKIKESF